MRVVNVWHIGAWNRNVGDWALAYQLHRLLNQQGTVRGVTFRFYMVDSQRTYFHPALVDQMEEEADLILIGGGGLIFSRPDDRSVSGWSFNIDPARLERIAKPIVVYAIGYNRFRFDNLPFPEVTGPHLRLLQSKASLFSVRNTGTSRILREKYGLSAEKLDIVPDPGICLYDRPIEIRKRQPDGPGGPGGPVIAVNWAGDRPQQRYPGPPEENAQRFLDALRKALLRCVAELGAQIMFLPHLMNIDTDVYGDFKAGFPEKSIFSLQEELPFLYPPPGEMLYPHIPFFTNAFRQANLAIGMRLHNCILAFGAGTPFIPLGSHPKLGFFAADVGSTRYAIPLLDPERETADEMFKIIRTCLLDAGNRSEMRSSLDRQLVKLRAFNERVIDLVC